MHLHLTLLGFFTNRAKKLHKMQHCSAVQCSALAQLYTGKGLFTNHAKKWHKEQHWHIGTLENAFSQIVLKWHKAVKSATVRWYTLHTETKKMVLVPIPVLELYQNHCKAFLKFIKMSYCYRARYILVRWYDAFFIFCWAQQEYLGS